MVVSLWNLYGKCPWTDLENQFLPDRENKETTFGFMENDYYGILSNWLPSILTLCALLKLDNNYHT